MRDVHPAIDEEHFGQMIQNFVTTKIAQKVHHEIIKNISYKFMVDLSSPMGLIVFFIYFGPSCFSARGDLKIPFGEMLENFFVARNVRKNH